MNGGVTFTYPEVVRLDRLSMACFGGAVIDVTYSVQSAASATSGGPVSLECDGETHRELLATPAEGVESLNFNATTDDEQGAALAVVIPAMASHE
ncbi:hypothetical protein JOF28_002421 [Leucobacter exalbidus]|uniref:Uncharacterized protein n=1 Tax=Leucobacter exalbidus TaxID=662960 RepID=A0A940PXJ0_9MICO|nr:hypothetical protein [Leucobacter exalbidus]MBP1327189.1 hypothetical protein [Leucobacter exalbidus]